MFSVWIAEDYGVATTIRGCCNIDVIEVEYVLVAVETVGVVNAVVVVDDDCVVVDIVAVVLLWKCS